MSLIKLSCPYCDEILPKVPERKTKCKNCGRFYFRRNRPDARYDYKIVTEEEAKEIDALWFRVNTAHVRVSEERKEINDIYKKIDQVRDWIQTATIYGSINCGGENMSLFQLEELEVAFIAQLEIASIKLQQRWYLDKIE
jgi:hypothetical protein